MIGSARPLVSKLTSSSRGHAPLCRKFWLQLRRLNARKSKPIIVRSLPHPTEPMRSSIMSISRETEPSPRKDTNPKDGAYCKSSVTCEQFPLARQLPRSLLNPLKACFHDASRIRHRHAGKAAGAKAGITVVTHTPAHFNKGSKRKSSPPLSQTRSSPSPKNFLETESHTHAAARTM